MNTMTMNFPARPRARSRVLLRALETWSTRGVIASACGIAAICFALGFYAWRESGLSHTEASRAELVAAQAKAEQTRRLIVELPALRAREAASGAALKPWTAADALQDIAQRAAQNGLRVTGIEPKQMDASQRAFEFHAEGAFPEIRRFLESLTDLPRLVVPERTRIERHGGVLGIDTTLRLYDALPAVPLAEPARADAFVVDPFGKERAGGFARGADLLLVGTLVGRKRGMALIQSGPAPGDIDGFVPGQTIGDERLGRVAPKAVELASIDGASRSLAFAEDGK